MIDLYLSAADTETLSTKAEFAAWCIDMGESMAYATEMWDKAMDAKEKLYTIGVTGGYREIADSLYSARNEGW